MLYMVFDVESKGLHGEGFAVGWVVVDAAGHELDAQAYACNRGITAGFGTSEQRQAADAWLNANLPPIAATDSKPYQVRGHFWLAWMHWQRQGAVLVADVPWPVEARFLSECIDDDPAPREMVGPYPLYDVATARMLAGFDPLAKDQRLPNELPLHHPLADARQSARLWLEALAALGK